MEKLILNSCYEIDGYHYKACRRDKIIPMELKENNKFLNTGNGEIRDCTICDENRVERIDCDVTTDRECVDIYDSDSPLTCENDIGNINIFYLTMVHHWMI